MEDWERGELIRDAWFALDVALLFLSVRQPELAVLVLLSSIAWLLRYGPGVRL